MPIDTCHRNWRVENKFPARLLSLTFRLKPTCEFLSRPSLTLRRQKVVVREWFDGTLSIRFKGKDLEYKEVDMVRPKPAVRVFAIKIQRKPPKYIPPPTHPWKRGPVVLGLK